MIKRNADGIVRFHDIGYAELGAQNERGSLKMGDTPISGIHFKQQPGANQIEIVDELRRRLDQIRRKFPPDINLEVAFDNTEYVRRSLLEVTETIFIAFALVVLVVFAFLREWRTTPDSGSRDTGLDRRHVRRHGRRGLLDQHADAARHRARHRARGGPCHRGAREHLRRRSKRE